MAGPFCAMQLCDMGADVIKVEPPDGDSTRQHGGRVGHRQRRLQRRQSRQARHRARPEVAGRTATRFRRLARARRHPHRELPARRDAPASGWTTPTLAAGSPALIYASISGYGQTGPDRGERRIRSDRAGRLRPDVGDRRARAGRRSRWACRSPISARRLFALAAILAALHHRDRTGRGQYIDTSLVEAGLALVGLGVRRVSSPSGVPPRAARDRRIACSRRIRRFAAPTATSRLAPANDRLFAAAVRRCSGIRSGPADAGLRRRHARVRNRAALIARIEAITADAAEGALARARSRPRGIPCGPINNYAEAFADPQVRAREMVVEIDHPTLGRLRTPGSPIKMSETPPVVGRRAPLLGEHTARGAARGRLQRRRDRGNRHGTYAGLLNRPWRPALAGPWRFSHPSTEYSRSQTPLGPA